MTQLKNEADTLMAEALKAQFSVLSLGLDFEPPFMLTYTEEAGRGLVATKDISVGEVIMVERPVVWGPKASDETCCHTCGLLLTELRKGQACSECNQPFCGEQCKNSTLHIQECQEMSKLSFDNLEKTSHLSLIIVPIRCLILHKICKIDDARIQLLKDHQNYSEQTQFELYNRKFLLNFIRTVGIKENEFSDKEVLKVCGVLNSNAYESKTLEGSSCRGLWPLTSMANSCCLPNTTHVINQANKLVLIASKNIQKGEEIFVCYTGTRWGRSARRNHLRVTKNFDCSCSRCLDATDAATYVSAVLCPACGGTVVQRIVQSRQRVKEGTEEFGQRVPESGQRVPESGQRVPESGQRVPESGQRVDEEIEVSAQRVVERREESGQRVTESGQMVVEGMPESRQRRGQEIGQGVVERVPESGQGVVERVPEPSQGLVERVPEPGQGVVERVPEPGQRVGERVPEHRQGLVERVPEPGQGVVERVPEPRQRVVEKADESDHNNQEKWTCETCHQDLSAKKVRFLEGMAGQLLKMVSKQNPQQLERLASKLSKSLAPTHYILLEIYMTLITLYQITSSHLERLVVLVDFVEPVIQKLEGLSKAVALLKFAKIHAQLKLVREDTKDELECVRKCREDYQLINQLLDNDADAPENYKEVALELGINKIVE